VKIALLALCALLAGCKDLLYTLLTEQGANEVFAVLARSGIEASKSAVGDEGWGM
jgi:type III secretion protein J